MDVLVVNSGSSSLKLSVIGPTGRRVSSADLPPLDGDELPGALQTALDQHPGIGAAGHRVVHGGQRFTAPAVIGHDADGALEALAELAPLHNPRSLAALHALRRLRPDLTQVACFDTSFHATMPPVATTYALPRRWRDGWGLRRFGFHGLSHAWASRRAGELLGRADPQLRLVTAHLGSGASLAAVVGGRSIDTSMGFTPLDGLVMSTRPGSLDPGLVIWAQRLGSLSPDQVEDALEHDAGLLGLSGRSGDLRVVIDAADRGDSDARLAYDVYLHRLRQQIAAMVTSMNGLDALVFTGGAGQASGRVRSDACAGLGFLGLTVDDRRNQSLAGDGVVSSSDTAPAVLVVRTGEDLEIARHVRDLVAG